MKTNYPTKKLGEICDILDNLRKPITKRDREPGPYPYYGATGIQDHVMGYIFDEELILVGEDGARWEAGDNSAYKISGKSWVNNHAHVLRPYRDIVHEDWLTYFLNFSDLSDYITGTTVKKLNQAKLRSIEIPLPPLSEQKKIVAKLEKLLAKISKAKKLRAEAQEAANQLLLTELHKIFEEGEKKGWEENELDSVVEITSSKRIYKNEYVEDGVPFFRTKEISELDDGRKIRTELFISKERFEKIRNKFGAPQENDILLTAIGTIGKMYIVKNGDKFYFKDGNVLWLRKLDSVDSFFLKMFLRFAIQEMQKLSAGSTYKALPINKLKKFKIPLPPVAEQKKIVARLDSISEKAKQLQEYQKATSNDLHALEQSILSKAFSGKFV